MPSTEQTWRLTFKDGTTMTVTAAPPEADGMWLEFTNVDGNKNLTLLARRAALVEVQLAPR